jgi:hypothetical protein
MSEAANAPEPTTSPSRSARLLSLVRRLIDYGRELAATIRHRAVADPDIVRGSFGTIDVALILERITRGLQRAGVLEARLLGSAERLDAARRRASSPRGPRAPRPAAARATDQASARLAHLPTEEQIAAEARRRPIGRVIADICRDLGITPRHPLWRQLSLYIIIERGSLVRLLAHLFDQARAAFSPTAPPQSPTPAGTGPP